MSHRLGVEVLEDGGRTHSATDTHGHDAVPCVAALEFMEERCGHTSARCAEGVSERYSAR